MICFAQAITDGYFPFRGVMVDPLVAGAFESHQNSFGAIGHGHTYIQRPSGRLRRGAGDAGGQQGAAVHRNAALHG